MREFTVIKKVLKRMVAALALLGISGLAPALHSFEMSQTSRERKIDYAAAQQEILRFESVVDGVVTSTFSSSPLSVVQKTKGAYLEGYGVSFAFLINIHRAIVNTPFGVIRKGPAATPELKKQLLEELKEKLIRALAENGKTFGQLGKEDRVTIIAFIEDRNFPDEPNGNKTIVLTALKKDIDESGRQNEPLKELQERIKIVEY